MSEYGKQVRSDLRLDVGLLKKDVETVTTLCHTVSSTLDKTESILDGVVKIITMHESQHAQHVKAEDEVKSDIRDLHSRVTTVNRELLAKMDEVELQLSNKLNDLHDAVLALRVTQDTSPNCEIEQRKDIEHELAALKESMQDIDRWKWTIMGAIALLAWLIGHVDLLAFLKLFK